jgi:hypothetical protein
MDALDACGVLVAVAGKHHQLVPAAHPQHLGEVYARGGGQLETEPIA